MSGRKDRIPISWADGRLIMTSCDGETCLDYAKWQYERTDPRHLEFIEIGGSIDKSGCWYWPPTLWD